MSHAHSTKIGSQRNGSTLEGITYTVANAIASPNNDSCRISFQFTVPPSRPHARVDGRMFAEHRRIVESHLEQRRRILRVEQPQLLVQLRMPLLQRPRFLEERLRGDGEELGRIG